MEREIPLYMLRRRPCRGDDPLTETVDAVASPSAHAEWRRHIRVGRFEGVWRR